MIEAVSECTDRVCQGDVIRDIEFVEYVAERDGIVEVSKIVFPLCVVLTQDCDLEQDHNFRANASGTQDKYLMSVLVAPLYNVEHVYDGSHLSELKLTMAEVPRKGNTGGFLRHNERPRYHYLEFPADTRIVASVIDFKHYFSANLTYLTQHKRTHFACRLGGLFRQDVSARFAAFLARVALPELGIPQTPSA
jgi:hypothetical protein